MSFSENHHCPDPWSGATGAHAVAASTKSATGQAVQTSDKAPYTRERWLIDSLPLLEGIGPLLPGAKNKRPLVGNGWTFCPGFDLRRLAAAKPETICWHIGAAPHHIAVDVDGARAGAFCQRHGCDPYTADTWRIERTSNTERLKVVFTVTDEQKTILSAGAKTVQIGAGEQGEGDKGEELAMFANSGVQIVVLGQHYTKESEFTENDDQYAWAGRPPSAAQPIPSEWFAFLTGVFCGVRPLAPPTRRQVSPRMKAGKGAYRSDSKTWINSGQVTPCPMCGRDHSGKCSISREGNFVWCAHGEKCSAPDCGKSGQVVTGTDGRQWGYVRTEDQGAMGERSLFKIHTPRPQPSLPMNGEAYIPAEGASNCTAPWGQGDTPAEQQAGSKRQQQPIKSKVVPGPRSGDPGPSAQSERVHQPNQQEPAPKTKENKGEEINLASCRSDWLPLVMQHVFMPNGERWVSVENILHQWTGTHYGSVADLELAPKVAKFLGRLSYYDEKTGEDVHEWGRPARVDEAIKWLKRQTAASIEDFNPANALNLQNGVLSWTWEDRKLVTRLDPHDPSQRFTYCQGYGYDPHASRDTLDKLLKAVEESEQDTFQRVMGSGLELARYRAVQGRPRAILAIGDGQNGKDTLQGAMSETLGNRGFTHCSIGDFQQYDKGRKFPLAPLYGSRINWSSENTGYARLESIQSLKTAITGERMSYEVKNVQEIPYSPNTLLIFNCNDAPRLDASSAAMESRWHVMAFRKRFTSRPDPNKPNELQADPRLKDDHQFIREAVCPAMLNWLLEGLRLAVSEGISYNPDSEALEAVRRQSCHLFDFVDDVCLAADPAGQVEASYVFELLWNWYQDQRILHLDPSTKRPCWNTHDLGGDHPVKIPRDLKARLRAVFPELRSERGTDKSRRSVLKGVRFVSSETNGGGTGASAGGTAEARAEA